MMVDAGTTIRMFCFYTYGGVGVYGHAVTVDLKESGTIVHAGVSAVDEGDGWYHIDHTAHSRCYPQATFKTVETAVDQKHIPALGFTMLELEEAYDNLTSTGFLIVGRGRGSVQWDDYVTDGINRIPHVVVKAYYVDNGTVIWDEIKAMDITDHEGDYRFYLDPGNYVVSVEKAGRQVTTKDITVV